MPKLLTQWQGFDPEDATWEPIDIMIEDVPVMVTTYVRDMDSQDPMKPILVLLLN